MARLPVFCAAASLWLSSLRPHLLFGPRANVPKIQVTKQQRSPRNSYFERGFVAALCGRGFVAGFLACASPSAEAASNACAKRPRAFMSPTVRFTCERRANSISTRYYGGVNPACPASLSRICARRKEKSTRSWMTLRNVSSRPPSRSAAREMVSGGNCGWRDGGVGLEFS